MEPGFDWYCSYDKENWTLIDAQDRWGAIKHVLSAERDALWICQARKCDFPYDSLFDLDEIDYDVIEKLPEIWGEDRYSIFDKDITKEQAKKLNRALIEAFKNWVAANEIQLATPWCFEETKDEERIDPSNYCWVWTTYSGEVYFYR